MKFLLLFLFGISLLHQISAESSIKRDLVIVQSDKLWPKGVMCYDKKASMQSMGANWTTVELGLNHWRENIKGIEFFTLEQCELWYEQNPSEIKAWNNVCNGCKSYVTFINDPNEWCLSSSIGMDTSQPQTIYLPGKCIEQQPYTKKFSTTAHEVGHALGFHHEQYRPDSKHGLHLEDLDMFWVYNYIHSKDGVKFVGRHDTDSLMGYAETNDICEVKEKCPIIPNAPKNQQWRYFSRLPSQIVRTKADGSIEKYEKCTENDVACCIPQDLPKICSNGDLVKAYYDSSLPFPLKSDHDKDQKLNQRLVNVISDIIDTGKPCYMTLAKSVPNSQTIDLSLRERLCNRVDINDPNRPSVQLSRNDVLEINRIYSEPRLEIPVSTTVAPSTNAPTTQAPSTIAPTTSAPTTTAPSTTAPTTQSPSTTAPSTSTPTTSAPTTQAPSTTAPTTQSPSTTAPTTQSPSTTSPTTQSPSTTAPTTQVPSTTSPTTQSPSTTSPTTQSPSTTAPTTQVPSTSAPTTQTPPTNSPATQSPSTTVPTTLSPVTPAPTTQSPSTSAPTTQSPSTSAPTTQSPSTTVPTTLSPVTPAPTTQASNKPPMKKTTVKPTSPDENSSYTKKPVLSLIFLFASLFLFHYQ